MNLDIINFPTFYGCDKKGVELAPETLIKNDLKGILESCGHNISNIIDIPIKKIEQEDKLKNGKNIKYFDEIFDSVKILSEKICESYSKNNFPLILGGDHSISIGSLSGFLNSFDNPAIIWIDAHGDLNTPSTSPSLNAHGMPLACAVGQGNKKFLSLFKKTIDSKNIFLFGIRSLDEGEKNLVINNEMHLYDTNSFNSLNHDLMIKTIEKYIKKNNIKNIHLSFDIDVFDPMFVPGTGTPVNDGLYVLEIKSFLNKLLSRINVVSMDFVEFNPSLDKDNKTLNLCLNMLKFLLRRINK